MPPWLEHLLGGLSPEGSITSFIGTIATFVAVVIVKVMQERKKLDKDMQSVPPTERRVSDSGGTVIATARRIWELEQEVHELRDVKADAVRTAQALSDSQRREEALQAELVELRRSVEGGHTRLPLPQSRTGLTPIRTVVELDDRPIEDKPTPTQGRAKVRP